MTSAMQAAAQDFTIPLQPIERSPAFEPLPPTPITAWWQGVVARHEGRIAVIANRGEARYADIEAQSAAMAKGLLALGLGKGARSEEHTSELQSLMRISYAGFCLKKKQ